MQQLLQGGCICLSWSAKPAMVRREKLGFRAVNNRPYEEKSVSRLFSAMTRFYLFVDTEQWLRHPLIQQHGEDRHHRAF